MKCHACSILTSFYSKICSNSFVKIIFNEYSTYVYKKTVFGDSFLLRDGPVDSEGGGRGIYVGRGYIFLNSLINLCKGRVILEGRNIFSKIP